MHRGHLHTPQQNQQSIREAPISHHRGPPAAANVSMGVWQGPPGRYMIGGGMTHLVRTFLSIKSAMGLKNTP
eukprot:610629-Amphidinium_carterae.2